MKLLFLLILIWPQTVAVTTSPDKPAVIMQTADAEALYSKLLDGSDPTMFRALTVALGKIPEPIAQYKFLEAESRWADCRRHNHRLFPCEGDELHKN